MKALKPKTLTCCTFPFCSIVSGRRVLSFTEPGSNHIAIYIADGEPTDSSLSFLYVPYTRYLPLDDEVEFSVAELVRPRHNQWHAEKTE